jgi:hypothetical protein
MARFKSNLNKTVRSGNALLKKSKRKLSRKLKSSPPMNGKRLDVLNGKLDIVKLINTHITPAHLKQLGMSEREFMDAVLETERRLGGQSATVNQYVGTFLEVVAPHHPNVKEIRKILRDMNVDIAIQSLTQKEASWMRAGTPRVDSTGKFIGHGVDLYWHDPQIEENILKKIDKLEAAYKNQKITPDQYAQQIDNIVQQRIKNLDRTKIIEVRDLTINGSEYCDRAILMRAKDGKWLVLLTEEYKTRASGGVNAQSSIRDTRLFHEKLDSDSKLGFHPVYGAYEIPPTSGSSPKSASRFYEPSGSDKPVTIDIRDVYLNTQTTVSDRFATKALSSGNQSTYETRALKVTRSIKERKGKFGEKVRKGEISDTVLNFVGLAYPGNVIRNLFQDVWKQLP